jgi:choline dehydrogenase-like flavoprotein
MTGRDDRALQAISRREASIMAAVADAAAAPEPPLPPVHLTDAVWAFDRWLAAAPALNRAALRAALLALELLPQLRGRSRFRRMERPDRIATLLRLQSSRLPLVGRAVEALRAAVMLSYYGDLQVLAAVDYHPVARMAEARIRRGVASTEGDHGADVDGTTVDGVRTLRADVCVIGAGAAGCVIAAELAEAGARVVVLEEGEQHAPSSLTGSPRETMARVYRDGGQTVTVGRPPIVLPLGQAAGGTTLVNSGTCFRTPDDVLARWRDDYGLDGLSPRLLASIFDRVERRMHVSEVAPEIAGANAAMIRRGAERLGWSGAFLRRNATGCQGSGVCAFGCPTGAKQHAGDAYLEPARDAGAVLCTHVRAERLLQRGARVIAAESRTAGGGRLRVEAETFVVAAGTVHTPLLLAANRMGHGSGQLGRNLSLHPATAAWGMFDDVIDMARGVPQSYCIDEFAAEGIMLEGIAGPPDYLAMSAPQIGAAHRELMLGHRHVGQCGLMVSDHSRGRVRGALGAPLIRYDMCDRDVGVVHTGLVRLAELLLAAGARSLVLPLAGAADLRPEDLPRLRAMTPRTRDLKLMAFHPLGTARAHADPACGVVDGDLRLHGMDNVYVADGSVVPSALGVNPMITIMALATRLAFHLRSEPCPS